MKMETRHTGAMRFDPFYFRDRAFWRQLIATGLPIALQNLIASSINLIDNLLVGQLGEKALGALAIANQVSFLVVLFTFGVASGASVFAAQYWGAGNVRAVRNTQGAALLFTVVPALIIATIAWLFARPILSFYTPDAVTLDLAVSYLRVSVVTYPLIALGFSWALVLRSIGRVRVPLVMSTIAMVVNVVLSLVLIFGLFGAPALGVVGAALGTVVARAVEALGMVVVSWLRRHPTVQEPRDLVHMPPGFLWRFLKTGLPVLANDLGWALGITALVALYAHRGTESLAAVSITDTVAQFLNIFIFGSVNATAIATGNLIGSGRINRTRLLVLRSTRVGFGIGLSLGVVMGLAAPLLPLAFNISATTRGIASGLLVVMAFLLPFRSLLYHQTVGLFRGAGDTRFPLYLEVGGLWLLGYLPAWLVASTTEAGVVVLFGLAVAHEALLALGALLRFRNPGWIKHLHRH